jgi:hypothetical protein
MSRVRRVRREPFAGRMAASPKPGLQDTWSHQYFDAADASTSEVEPRLRLHLDKFIAAILGQGWPHLRTSDRRAN